MTAIEDVANWPLEQRIQLLATLQHGRWLETARPEQLPPDEGWRVWYLMAGRGAGKTRAAAEWLAAEEAKHPPGEWAVVAPTFADARDTCAEQALLPALGARVNPKGWNRSLGEIFLKSGSRIYLDGADDGALRIQGKNLRGCIASSECILTLDGEKAVKDVAVGEYVATRQGWRRVTDAFLTATDAPVVRVVLTNGRSLQCTPDHRVWSEERGWIEAQDLRKNEHVLTFSQDLPHGSTSTENATTDATPATTRPNPDTNGSMLQSGNGPTDGQSPKDSSSTTSTKTGTTTTPPTSNFSHAKNTTSFTTGGPCDPPSLASGSRSERRTHGREDHPESSSVRTAARRSQADRTEGQSVSAPSNADNSHVSEALCIGGNASRRNANGAARSSHPRTDAAASAPKIALTSGIVSCVQQAGTDDVYDLSVEGCHEFFASGILVHNCWADEVGLWAAKWPTAWNESISFAVRHEPGLIVATGTPKMGHGLVAQLVNDDKIPVSRMRTIDNVANLQPAAVAELYEQYGGTRLGQQELEGEWVAAIEGDLLKRAWWRYYPARKRNENDQQFLTRMPRFQMVLVSVDTPLKDKESSDFVAIQVWGVDKANRYLLDARTERMGYDACKRAVIEMSRWARRMWPCQHRTLIENAGFGTDLIVDLKRDLGLIEKIPVGSEGSKGMRALSASGDLETGACYLPGRMKDDLSGPDESSPAITHSLVEEAALFQVDGSHGSHDDQVDAWSQAMNYLRSRAGGKARGWSAFKHQRR